MNTTFKLAAAAAVVLSISACASQPEPVEQVEEQAPVEVAKPAPAPAPVVEQPAAPTGPVAGSLEDFRVNVGERVYFDLNGYRLDVDDQHLQVVKLRRL